MSPAATASLPLAIFFPFAIHLLPFHYCAPTLPVILHNPTPHDCPRVLPHQAHSSLHHYDLFTGTQQQHREGRSVSLSRHQRTKTQQTSPAASRRRSDSAPRQRQTAAAATSSITSKLVTQLFSELVTQARSAVCVYSLVGHLARLYALAVLRPCVDISWAPKTTQPILAYRAFNHAFFVASAQWHYR